MLATADLEPHLNRLTYKPGWSFELGQDDWEGQTLRIIAPVADPDNPGESTVLGIDTFVPPVDDVDQFERWLMWRLARIETHEMREFFRRDGLKVDDPHQPRPE